MIGGNRQYGLAIALVAGGRSPPREGVAEGALAIGHPVDVAKDGCRKSSDSARRAAHRRASLQHRAAAGSQDQGRPPVNTQCRQR
jgi:hypothetical protein